MSIPQDKDYIGRFAPSPTGPLHYGSLVAALASYLDARHYNGRWLLRIEDLDPPRESPDAPGKIIDQLKAFELLWDGDVLYQSSRLSVYQEAISELGNKGLTFPCSCSRKETPAIYPGTCRHLTPDRLAAPYAIRLKVGTGTVSIEDGVFGHQSWNLADDVGDFVIHRKDGLTAYQLAVVVDDDFQGITQIVRGADLLDSTPKQLVVYRSLELEIPDYVHIPILVDSRGHKLSKQSRSPAVNTTDPESTIRAALKDLGQNPQEHCGTLKELLGEAVRDWQRNRIPRLMTLEV